MRPFARHPDLDVLAAFSAGELTPDRRARVADHLRACARCQGSLRFIRRLDADATSVAPTPPPHLLAGALAARAAGERRILPIADSPAPARSGRRAARWAAAAAAAVVVAVALVARTPSVEAVDVESEMRLSPAVPVPGQTVHVRYRPTPGLFGHAERLVLRARLRGPEAEAYDPLTPVRAVASLRRRDDGEYEGTFTLPDSVVYAALAVEDTAAEVVDDRNRRAWEVLVAAADGRPSFEALYQRQVDMLGRSWEEGHATARRAAELYPDRHGAWSLLQFYERQLLGPAAAESASAVHRPRLDSIVRAYAARADVPAHDMGGIVFDAYFRDSTAFAYWWPRLRREHPGHEQISQLETHRLGVSLQDTAPRRLLDELERLYHAVEAVDGRHASLHFNTALRIARQLDDVVAYRRWTERMHAGRPDSVSKVALVLARYPASRNDGMAQLRRLLAGGADTLLVPVRRLGQDAASYADAILAARRSTLAALGRALVASGETRAGLDTLQLAADGTWDVAVFRDIAAARATAGDHAGALAMGAKLAVDPRTTPTVHDSLVAEGRRRMGEAAWGHALDAAREEMHARYLGRASVHLLRGTPSLVDANGREHTLRELTGARPAVVIFWSRHCAPAVAALAAIDSVATRLRSSGTPVIVIADEPKSPQLDAFLAKRGVTLPVYHDPASEATRAFGNFGTPAYYVLDQAGRIRYRGADGEAELLIQVAALRTEAN